jgi:hypothetical protein
MALDAITLLPALAVGEVQRRTEVAVPVQPLIMDGMAPAPHGAVIPQGDASTVSVAVPPQPAGIEQVRLRIRLFKPVDAKLWSAVKAAYRNQLNAIGQERVDVRTIPFASPEAADSVFLRQSWAREGEEFIVDDRGH